MKALKIPKNNSGISKTLRLPENIVKDVQILSDVNYPSPKGNVLVTAQ